MLFLILTWPVFLIFASCHTADPSPIAVPAIEDAPDQEAWNTTIYLSRKGRKEAMVRAGHRESYTQSEKIMMDQGVYIEFFNDAGEVASTLTADRGVIDGKAKSLRVMGSVSVFNPERGTLETDSLRWINDKNLIVTDAAVRLVSGKDEITGRGFEANPNLQNWTIRSQIQGRFLPKTEDPP